MSFIKMASGVTSIGEYAFARCMGLKEVIVRWYTPLTVSATVFSAIDMDALTLKVPEGAAASYRAANVWNSFGRILVGSEPDPGNNPDPDPDPEPGPGDDGNEADFVVDANGKLTGYACTGSNAVIPSRVKSIGVNAFENCKTLVSVTIPQSVTSISSLAFAGCTGLREVNVAWDTPVSISSLVFQGVDLSGVTLNVPAGREAVYRSASVWRLFGTIATGNEALSAPPAVTVRYEAGLLTVHSPAAERVSVYSLAGALLYSAAKSSGPSTFALPHSGASGGSVVIVAGSSGWTEKVYVY
jgi:hypothetical protein